MKEEIWWLGKWTKFWFYHQCNISCNDFIVFLYTLEGLADAGYTAYEITIEYGPERPDEGQLNEFWRRNVHRIELREPSCSRRGVANAIIGTTCSLWSFLYSNVERFELSCFYFVLVVTALIVRTLASSGVRRNGLPRYHRPSHRGRFWDVRLWLIWEGRL